MFLSSLTPSVVCGSAVSAKEAAASAAVEVADEVGVDIADALDVLTFKEAKGHSDKRLVKETSERKRSRYITFTS